MKISTFRYFLRDSFQSIRRNSLMSIASIFSVVASLIILGIFLVFALNVKYITNQVEKELELKVFLKDDYSIEQKNQIELELANNEYVDNYVFESKEEALINFSEELGEYSSIFDGYEEDNPLPESYIVSLKDSSKIKDVYNSISTIDGVEYVNYGEKYVDALLKFNNFTNIISIVILIILSCISLFIIYNTIKLTVFARRKEIGIMKYVGATNWYIRIPFIIEGSLLGIIGAILSILFIRNGYFYLIGIIQGQAILPMNSSFAPASIILPQVSVFFIIYGLVIGALGSTFSIKKFLKV